MEFVYWHFKSGINYYLDSWINQFNWIVGYFSLPLLLRSLFSPWKKMIYVDKKPGIDLKRIFEVVTFNLISRGIGAVVRFTLFWAGVVMIIFTFLGGGFGFLIWALIPLFSYPVYKRYKSNPEEVFGNIWDTIKISKGEPLEIILASEPLSFFLSHLGLTSQDVLLNLKKGNLDLSKIKPKSLTEFTKYLIDKKVLDDDFLRRKGLIESDLTAVSSWWDSMAKKRSDLSVSKFARPSIGLELLFGYTPTLNQYCADLSRPRSFSHRLIGREDVVSRIERSLSSGNSVVLLGQPGVGKKTVILEFAKRASSGQLGSKMAFKRILEFDYNYFLSESVDLNKKKKNLTLALEEAATAGNIILMIRDLQRLTHVDLEGHDFTDIFESYLEKKNLKIIAVTTPSDYEKFLAPNLRLRKFLEAVEVKPPNKAQALEILLESAKNVENRKNVLIHFNSLRKILDDSDKYITETPFPEKALEILDAVVTFIEQKGSKVLTVDDVNSVLSEKTGISFARLTESEKKKLGNLEKIIHERLVDQDAAVGLIAKSLRAKTVGATESKRPIGSFLFLGPTGVGKTETAKVLSKVYYGSEDQIIRFDMAEYSGSEGMERLIGSQSKNLPGALTTSIKNRPASLLLLDEIEKSSPEIFNLFLSLLDEGKMTDAFGKEIIGRHLFVIGTSNAGAEYIRQLVSKGVKGADLQEKVLNHVLEEGIFTPEFINRFDGVVVYEPLGKEELLKIAEIMLKELSVKLKKRGYYLIIDPKTIDKLSTDGFDPAFGARPMRRIIDLVLGDLVGKAVLENKIKDGDKIKILPKEGKDQYYIERVSS